MMTARKPAMAVALILTVIVALAGCSRTPSAPTTTSSAAPATTTKAATTTTATSAPATTTAKPATTSTAAPAPSGQYGELRIAVGTFGNEKLDPIAADGTFANLVPVQMFDYMFWLDNTGTGPEVTPRTVEKWQVSPDGLSWTYYVRKGIKFQNGDNLTAADVKFSLERFSQPDAYRQFTAQNVKNMELVDDYTLRITTKAQQFFLHQGGVPNSPTQGMIMPKNYIEKNGVANFLSRPMGSGPWKFVEGKPGDSYQMEAVATHWRQAPAFKKLTIMQMPEEATRIALMKTGGADFIDISLNNVTNLESAGLSTFSMGWYAQQFQLHGVYDQRSAGMPTADIKVRQALSLAVDRNALLKDFYLGKGLPALPPSITELADEVDLPYWKDYVGKLYKYDPETSKKLLSDAGYAKGFSINLYTFPGRATPFMPQLAEVIQNYWGKIGVTAKIVNIESGSYNRWRVGPATELVGQATTYWNSPGFTLGSLLSDWGSTGTATFLGKGTPQANAADKLLASAAAEPDPAKRRATYAEVIKMATDSFAVGTLASAPGLMAMGKEVTARFPFFPSPSVGLFTEIVKHK
ncbi:MAG: ABC transporter substrate-binding protein [Chloroflexi bacterium]|nr:ABC transporter substrate-binding protein [Chloroflexota bacterium]